MKSSSGVDVIVFSGHDVNLLALLHVLDAGIVRDKYLQDQGHWPDYGNHHNYTYTCIKDIVILSSGSVLTFEVITDYETPFNTEDCTMMELSDERSTVAVNVYYNSEPLLFRVGGKDMTSITINELFSIFSNDRKICT